MTALGFLYPGHTAEDDYPRIEQLLGSDIRLDVVRTDPADPERLAVTGEQLRLTGAEAVVRVGGAPAPDLRTAHEQVRALALITGMPASSTSFAFVHAAKELGVTRLALAATSGESETDAVTTFLGECGLEVTRVHAGAGDDLLALARDADTPDAQAVLFPDPSLRTAAHLHSLEDALGKPVLTASQATVWEALRLTDRRVNAPKLGSLFTREPIVQV
ncbi:decarboxylase [Streptomyces sp. NPDC091377]|uniref:aspartate racemase/maleate isomerase family protein n=1 Tax=unclassified Streptomyces TaxID=2593676 RepID=UPI00380F9FF9